MLRANEGISVIGSFVLGIGFVFENSNPGATSLDVAAELIAKDSRNATRIFRYLSGEDLTTSPSQTSDRLIIDFGEMTEDEARQWPELYAIVSEKVKPARASVKQRDRREEWWRHATRSPVLRAYAQQHKRILAMSQVTSHLALTFVPNDVVLSHTCVAFLLHLPNAFAILQSRVHGAWAQLHASSLERRLRYTPTDCFETFPFPAAAALARLDDIGQHLYDARAAYMLKTQRGLTQTYNFLKDPECTDPEIEELRSLHLEMDRQVLTTYGWQDLIDKVPPYTTPKNDAEKKAFAAFEDAVIDRLFDLNAKRAPKKPKKNARSTGHA